MAYICSHSTFLAANGYNGRVTKVTASKEKELRTIQVWSQVKKAIRLGFAAVVIGA